MVVFCAPKEIFTIASLLFGSHLLAYSNCMSRSDSQENLSNYKRLLFSTSQA